MIPFSPKCMSTKSLHLVQLISEAYPFLRICHYQMVRDAYDVLPLRSSLRLRTKVEKERQTFAKALSKSSKELKVL
ncbi:hypothetical protein P8452_29062 [Trifolium repens]|nr:hypothetical protein P8452_29062 [Trifolium repens]